MPIYKTEGFTLKRHDLGEADRIMVIFTKNAGKVRAVAKGVRQIQSKFAGSLEPFNVVNLRLAKGRNLDIVTYASALKVFKLDQASLEVVSLGYLLMEMIDRMLADHQPNIQAYNLTLESLAGIEAGLPLAVIKHYFYLKLLQATGHQPNLDMVSSSNVLYFDFEHGNLAKQAGANPFYKVSHHLIKAWRLILALPLMRVAQIKDIEAIADNNQAALDDFYRYRFGLEFKSAKLSFR